MAALAEASASRHYAKRYYLRVERFSRYQSVSGTTDDPLYVYLLREPLTAAQIRGSFKLESAGQGKSPMLLSTSFLLRRLFDTTDAELLLFSQGLGGSISRPSGNLELEVGETDGASPETCGEAAFEKVARRTTIAELLDLADSTSGVVHLLPLHRHVPAFREYGCFTAWDFLRTGDEPEPNDSSDDEVADEGGTAASSEDDSGSDADTVKNGVHQIDQGHQNHPASQRQKMSRGQRRRKALEALAAAAVENRRKRRVVLTDDVLSAPPFHLQEGELRRLRSAVHRLRAEHCGGATFEQELLSIDAEEISGVLVIQPPDVKPLKGPVSVAAYCNLLPCRMLESVLLAQDRETERAAQADAEAKLEEEARRRRREKKKMMKNLLCDERALGSAEKHGEKENGQEQELALAAGSREAREAFLRREGPLQRMRRELLLQSSQVRAHQAVLRRWVRKEKATARQLRRSSRSAGSADQLGVNRNQERQILVKSSGSSGSGTKERSLRSPTYATQLEPGSPLTPTPETPLPSPPAMSRPLFPSIFQFAVSAAATSNDNNDRSLKATSPHREGTSSSNQRVPRAPISAAVFAEAVMSLTSVLEARKVAKSILKTETVRHVNEALFGELLRRYCGVVCFSSRISLVYRAVVEHYGIGRKGLDLDSFAIALLLVRRTRSTVLEGQPAFVTPTDAMIAFDLDLDGFLNQPEYVLAIKSCFSKFDTEVEMPPEDFVVGAPRRRTQRHGSFHGRSRHAESALQYAFVEHCNATGTVDGAAFRRCFLDLCDSSRELWRRRKITYGEPIFASEIKRKLARKKLAREAERIATADGRAGVTEISSCSADATTDHDASHKAGIWGLLKAAGDAADHLMHQEQRLAAVLLAEEAYLGRTVVEVLARILDEEEERARTEQELRTRAAEESIAAANEVRQNAAIQGKKDKAAKEKRRAEEQTLKKTRARLAAAARQAAADRVELIRQTAITQKREERERKEQLRAALGADVLSLRNLRMHHLREHLGDAALKRGVSKPRVVLGQLVELDVSENSLQGSLDSAILFQLNSLLKFDASRNMLRSAEGIEQLQGLRILRLSFNDIGPSLPLEFGGKPDGPEPIHGYEYEIGSGDNVNALTLLESLSIDNNRLESLPPTFGGLVNLRRLEAFNNSIGRLPRGCLGPLSALVELRLRHNKLEALPNDIGGLKNVRIFDVGYNLLSDLPPGLKHLGRCIQLDASFNKLSLISTQGLQGMTSLQFLELQRNQLRGDSCNCISMAAIGNLQLLNVLDLSGNSISALGAGEVVVGGEYSSDEEGPEVDSKLRTAARSAFELNGLHLEKLLL